MNRHMTEVGSAALPPERQKETAHRYMLGLYRIMDEITTVFPNVLFEGCSGGGGRFDPGILYYMPQILTSDNSDAVDCIKIKYGASIVYPLIAIEGMSSPVPNFMSSRTTSLEMRGSVNMSGNLGYYLDITKLTEEEKEIVKKQIMIYKEIRHLIQFGNFYRMSNPFEGNETAWMFVSEDKSEAFVAYFRVLAQPNEPLERLRLKGLDPDMEYKLMDDRIYGGDELMYIGLDVPKLHGDFQSVVWRLKRNK
jgi:alpha-galactosidase